MENKDITICLTSCGRFNLLERTIKSLVQNWDGPKRPRFLLNEDSGNGIPERIALVIDKFSGGNSIFFHPFKKGQILGCDTLMQNVETKYVMWMEDDWEFTRPGFIQPSLDILESDPKILQVWIRDQNDRNGHPVIGMRHKTPNGTYYQKLSRDYRKVWAGFSWNPGLRRKSDYDLIAPFSSYMTGNTLHTEAAISQAYKKHGFYAATLLKGYVKHIGGNFSLDKKER